MGRRVSKAEQIVAIWMSGLGVLLERRWDGFAIIPAGRKIGAVLEIQPTQQGEMK
jgi:hypothetical protein